MTDKSLLEVQTGIVVACMPAANQVCRRVLPSYASIKETLSHYWSIGRSSAAGTRPSGMDKDPIDGVLELYDSEDGRAQHRHSPAFSQENANA